MSAKKSDNKLSVIYPGNYKSNDEKSSYSKKKSSSIKNNIKEDNKIFNYTKSFLSSSNFNLLKNKSFSSEMKRQKTYQKSNLSKKNKNTKNNNILNCSHRVKTKKSCNKESSIISDSQHGLYCKPVRKDSRLLFQINKNILNSSRNLINPSQYYKNYFNSLINNNKKKDIDNSINRRNGRFLNLNSNFNVKAKDEKKGKSSKRSRKNFQYSKDV